MAQAVGMGLKNTYKGLKLLGGRNTYSIYVGLKNTYKGLKQDVALYHRGFEVCLKNTYKGLKLAWILVKLRIMIGFEEYL